MSEISSAAPSLRTVRIFVSSPGDMSREREVVMRVCQRLQGEFAAYLKLEPYFWEHEPMYGSRDFQEAIEPPANFDLYLCLLWSRLGTRLHPGKYKKADGSPYESGTEFECENALKAYHENNGRPELLIYRRKSRPDIPLTPPAKHEEKWRQYTNVRNFLNKWLRDSNAGDAFRAGYNSYNSTESFEIHLEKALRHFLRDKLPDDAVTHPVASWTHGSPFRSLNYFDFGHSPVFCGRTKAVDEVFMALQTQLLREHPLPFVLISGSSGVGKSSLARAGVLPLLLRPHAELKVAVWRYVELRPADLRQEGEDLCGLLARALVQERSTGAEAGFSAQALQTPPPALPELLGNGVDEEFLASRFREAPDSLIGFISGALQCVSRSEQTVRGEKKEPPTRLCLLLDQLEELFTLDWISADERNRFFRAIYFLVKSGLVFVIATLRGDFLDRCESIPELMALKKNAGHYHLEPPHSHEIGRLIRLPAQSAGLAFEKDDQRGNLDDVLRDAVAQREEQSCGTTALPLLEFTLQTLYERAQQREDARERHVLRFADYDQLGAPGKGRSGLEGAIAQRAEDIFLSALSPTGQAAFPTVMRHLVRLTDDAFTRVPARRDVLDAIEGGRELVDVFVSARLLTADTLAMDDRNLHPTVSLVHEALLVHWDRLAQWLADMKSHFQIRARLGTSAQTWLEARQDDPGKEHEDLLLPPGTPLQDGKYFLNNFADELPSQVRRFIQQSIQRDEREEKRRNRILRRWVAVLTVLSVLAVGAGIGFWHMFRNAESARDVAEDMVNFMLVDLSKQFVPIGRVDIAENVVDTALDYYARFDIGGDDQALRPYMVAMSTKGDIWRAKGNLREASACYEQTLAAWRQLQKKHPQETVWQRHLAFSLDKVGDVYTALGKLEEARKAYEESLTIRRGWVGRDSANTTCQYDLMLSLDRVGGVYTALGKLEQARKAYEESLAVIRELASRDPANTAWQRDMAVSLANVGDVYRAQGKLERTRRAYEEFLAVMRKLAGRNPAHTAWQRDLTVSLNRIGDVYRAQGKLEQARKAYEESLAVMRDLAGRDPANTAWQRDLTVSLNRIGDVYRAQGKLEQARKAYEESLAVMRELAGREPANSAWQRDIVVSLYKLSTLGTRICPQAAAHLEEAIAIMERLSRQDPSNAKWRNDLRILRSQRDAKAKSQ